MNKDVDQAAVDAIQIREAGPPDHASIRQCMADIFRETASHKIGEFGEPLWSWQYLKNKTGSIVVIANDGQTVCGYYHILLFPMRYEGNAASGAMVQDVG